MLSSQNALVGDFVAAPFSGGSKFCLLVKLFSSFRVVFVNLVFLQVVEKVYNPSSTQHQPLLTFKTRRCKYEKRSESCRNLQEVLELVCRGARGNCRQLAIDTIEECEEVVSKREEVVDVDEEGGEHVELACQRGGQPELQDSEDQQQPGEANPGWLGVMCTWIWLLVQVCAWIWLLVPVVQRDTWNLTVST